VLVVPSRDHLAGNEPAPWFINPARCAAVPSKDRMSCAHRCPGLFVVLYQSYADHLHALTRIPSSPRRLSLLDTNTREFNDEFRRQRENQPLRFCDGLQTGVTMRPGKSSSLDTIPFFEAGAGNTASMAISPETFPSSSGSNWPTRCARFAMTWAAGSGGGSKDVFHWRAVDAVRERGRERQG
jgi:hypothetical protein